ncbi:DUF1573 domain-containing protein [Ponticaulis koreensis]|uniref:DUF1573 domain-containing protein n=1 Tax=Ponticaulis koreensis TaxID=1123045 RepID=UPI0003B6F241|nr:DUF1573 domain-containing protein [Ponticaulis koreensis]
MSFATLRLSCLAFATLAIAPVSVASDEDAAPEEQIETVDPAEAMVETGEMVEAYAIRAPDDKGVIGFDAASVNFGDVEHGSILEHTYLFLNNGFGPLSVQRGYSQTSGVSVRISPEPVPGNELGEIKISINTDGMEGEQYIRIHVVTDAFNGPDSTLYARAVVWPVGEMPVEEENAES